MWITLEFTYLLEVVTDLKLTLLGGDVGLDFSVCVVNDGQEHIEQDKEHEEHIGDEEDWTKDTIGSLQSMEVEITQDNTEQCKATRENKTVHINSKITLKKSQIINTKKVKLEFKAPMPALCNAFAWFSDTHAWFPCVRSISTRVESITYPEPCGLFFSKLLTSMTLDKVFRVSI